MISINHYTVNSKHNRISYPEEIEKEFYFYLRGMVKDSQREEGVELLDDTNFKLTLEGDDCYIGTLSAKIGNYYCPVLTTAGTSKPDERMYVWDTLMDFKKQIFKEEEKELIIPPAAPFILDLILPFPVNQKIYKWTGDFTRCLGWILLFLDAIK